MNGFVPTWVPPPTRKRAGFGIPRRNRRNNKRSTINVKNPRTWPELDTYLVSEFIESSWGQTLQGEGIVAKLGQFIQIENQSPSYDPNWSENGLLADAATFLCDWVTNQNVEGLSVEQIVLPGAPPVIFVEVEATMPNAPTVFMYGHYDKQPPLNDNGEWVIGGPYTPVIENGKLYGRGGADDGYSLFASLDCVRALKDQNLPHPRIRILIEGEEESGSEHLLDYVDLLASRIGTPQVVFCLDSGAGNYDQWWMTVSLRGLTAGTLRTQLITDGIHSGNSGIVRSSFHVTRQLLDRIDNVHTRKMKLLQAQIPQEHRDYATEVATALGEKVWTDFPFVPGAEPQMTPILENGAELLLNKTWRPQLCIIGDDLPGLGSGNVLRKETTVEISIRTPPTSELMDKNGVVTGQDAGQMLKEELERDPPMGCEVEYIPGLNANGFLAPQFDNYLRDAIESASQTYFGASYLGWGEGGTIPFMGDLLDRFPQAQFVVTGVLGPGSNAHGPNESLDIAYCKKVVSAMANVLYAVAQNKTDGARRRSKL